MTKYRKSLLFFIVSFMLLIAFAMPFFFPVNNASAMQIFYKVISNPTKTHTLEVDTNNCIGEIKAKIQEKSSIPVDSFIIMYNGKLLYDENKTLSDYNVQKESTINVVIRTDANSCHETENCPGIYISSKCGVCGLDKTAIPETPESSDTPSQTQPIENKDWILPVAIGGGAIFLFFFIATPFIIKARKKR